MSKTLRKTPHTTFRKFSNTLQPRKSIISFREFLEEYKSFRHINRICNRHIADSWDDKQFSSDFKYDQDRKNKKMKWIFNTGKHSNDYY